VIKFKYQHLCKTYSEKFSLQLHFTNRNVFRSFKTFTLHHSVLWNAVSYLRTFENNENLLFIFLFNDAINRKKTMHLKWMDDWWLKYEIMQKGGTILKCLDGPRRTTTNPPNQDNQSLSSYFNPNLLNMKQELVRMWSETRGRRQLLLVALLKTDTQRTSSRHYTRLDPRYRCNKRATTERT
jgi:hypothetical protein